MTVDTWQNTDFVGENIKYLFASSCLRESAMSQWYYQLLGEEFGPVTAEVLLELIEDGTISESDPVRPVESADWQPASSYAELRGAGDDVISDLSELSFEFEESGPTARKTAYGTVHAAAEEQSESLPEVKGPVGYFYQVQGVSLGPIPLQSLVQLASGGRLLASDLVQAEGDRLWRTAAEFSELAVIFAAQVQAAAAAAPQVAAETPAEPAGSGERKSSTKPSGVSGKGRKKAGRESAKAAEAAVDDILSEVFAEEEPQPVRRGVSSGMSGVSSEASVSSSVSPSVAASVPAASSASSVSAVSATAAAAAKSYKAPAKPKRSSGGGMSLEFGTPAKAVLGLVLAGVLFWFSGPLLKVFKSDYDRYAKRTELAIQTIEALNPKTQVVAYKGQMMSVEKELGAYLTVMKSSGAASGKSKHLVDALEKMLEFAKMDPKEAEKQKQAVSEAKALIQQYRGG